ncbi:MAG: family 10 glycosylhydrolase [Oscillospiraceae bacterium]|jgi:hypothetical protein|nr:family 10 glycosylhydrolase [Oscillospiraceae bacterium]
MRTVKKFCFLVLSFLFFFICLITNAIPKLAVWFSCYDISRTLVASTEREFRVKATKVLDTIKNLGIKVIGFHVVSHADANYPSEIYPLSKFICGVRGGTLPFDPFAIILELTCERGIDVYAWFNPFRIGRSLDDLIPNHPAKILYERTPGAFLVATSGVWFNPGCPEAVELIKQPIIEVAKKYGDRIRGIIFDDYFYPLGYVVEAQEAQNNISAFISSVGKEIKNIAPNCQFVISPTGNFVENARMGVDIQAWLKYVDVIVPQLYYGRKNAACPFEKTEDKWGLCITGKDENGMPVAEQIRWRFLTEKGLPLREFTELKKTGYGAALAVYKVGREDKYAGVAGQNEWIEDGLRLLLWQIEFLSRDSRCEMIWLFNFDSVLKLFQTRPVDEICDFMKVLQRFGGNIETLQRILGVNIELGA